MIDRRRFLIGGTIAIAAAPFARAAYRSPFAAIEADLGGRVGVMVRDTGNGEEMLHRADERFAMCSVFKWPLAAMVLSRVDRGEVSFEQEIRYGHTDLLDYSPVTRRHIDQGVMTVDALCHAAVTVSDNTAANLLLELVGGPAELTSFLRECGDTVTRLDRYEPDLNSNLPGDERDTTTPRAMLGTMETLLLGDALAIASRERLIGWLQAATTGRARLRAGLPPDWTVGDKTGTGHNGAANDIAIAWPVQGKPVLIAAFLSGSGRPYAELNAAHERIGEAIAEHLSM
jgi:beta-lactamase class A